MGKKLSVEIEQLYAAAAQVDGHAEAVLTGHAQADGWLESVEAELRGLSATALAVTATKWRQRTTALGSAVAGHAEAMRASGSVFSAMEERHARELNRVAPPPAGPQ
ncbi:hypothetical protein BH10ACT9_BH10ACT9_43790 [soil metagenome]